MTSSVLTAPAASQPESARPAIQIRRMFAESNFSPDVAIRLLLVLGAVGLAMGPTLRLTVRAVVDGDQTAYLAAVPVWAIMPAVAPSVRRRRAPDITDRQLDWIVACVLIFAVLVLARLLEARLDVYAFLWRIDLLVLIGVLAACSTIVFGLRGVLRHRSTFIILLSAWPPAHRVAVAALGGTVSAAAGLNIAMASGAVLLFVDGRIVRKASATALCAMTGMLTLALLGTSYPLSAVTLPGIVGPVVATVTLVVHDHRIGRPHHRTFARPKFWRPAPLVAFVCVITAVVVIGPGLPKTAAVSTRPVGMPDAVALARAGWARTSTLDESATHLDFGVAARVTRTQLTRVDGDVAVVDVITNARKGALLSHPAPLLYGSSSAAQSSGWPVSLPGFGRATIWASAASDQDDPVHVAWLLLSWTGTDAARPNRYERVNVLLPLQRSAVRGIELPAAQRLGTQVVLATVASWLRGKAAPSTTPTPARIAVALALAEALNGTGPGK